MNTLNYLNSNMVLHQYKTEYSSGVSNLPFKFQYGFTSICKSKRWSQRFFAFKFQYGFTSMIQLIATGL